MKKKLLSMLLVLVMLLGMLPMGALAAESEAGALTIDGAYCTIDPALGYEEDGTVSYEQWGTPYGPFPKYLVQIPAGTETVTLTLGNSICLTYYGDTCTFYYGTMTWTGDGYTGTNNPTDYTAIAEGVSSIQLNVAELIQNEQFFYTIDKDFHPLYAIEFEYVAASQPEAPEAGELTIPDTYCTIDPALTYEEDGTVSYEQWGTPYGPFPKYLVQIPAGTETVTLTLGNSICLTYYGDVCTFYYGTMAWTGDGYTGTNNATDYTAIAEGVSSIQLNVADLIQTEQFFYTINKDFHPIYAIEFEYAAASGGGHECRWNDGTVTKEATCQETGILTKTCTVKDCGKTMIEDIPKTDHNWNNGVIDPKPTCQTAGTKTFTCQTANCGEIKTETVAASAEYHQWNAGEVTTQPTCGAKGTTTYTCQMENCGATKTADIAMLNTHSFDENDTTQEKCSVCNTPNPNYVNPNMPEQVDGVYQIGSADQLLAFAAFVNKGNTNLKAALTADINLSGKTWTPMKNFGGSFDGQNHIIIFENASNGLFESVHGVFKNNNYSPYAEVSNVIIAGSISGSTKIGAIAGTAYGTKITNCINRATVTGTGDNVGGLVGFADYASGGKAYAYVLIEQCGNEAAVSGKMYVGGLLGYTRGGSSVKLSYNTAQISGTSSAVGGLVGFMQAYSVALSVQNSYNLGKVTGSSAVGGLIGQINKNASNTISVENCYTADTSEKIVGTDNNAGNGKTSITNSYYLSSTAGTNAKTDEEMKSADFVSTLGEYYRKSSTYPVLSWQVAQGAAEYSVTKPTIAGITFTGADTAYDNEDYIFTVKINNRYRITDEFAIQINDNEIEVNYELADGVYTCTVAKENITANLVIEVLGVEATKTVVYTGTGKPVSWVYVSEIAVDDVAVKSTITDGNTIYVVLEKETAVDADVYFTVTKFSTTGDSGLHMLNVSPGTGFTRQLNAGSLTEIITGSVANNEPASWTIVVTVDGITTHKVTLPSGTGYTVTGSAAAVGGQPYTFNVALGNTYMAGDAFAVKVNGTTDGLTANGDGSYTVANVSGDLVITVEGVVEKPFEDPFVSIKVGDQTLAAENIELMTKDFHLGGKGVENFEARVYENVPYYHVSVPKGTTVVEVIFKAITDILLDSNDDTKAWGYTTDIEALDTVSSATIAGTPFDFTVNEDGTKSLQIPVTGYTVNSNGGKAIGPEMEGQSNQPVALFSFLFKHQISVNSVGFTVIPADGYSTTVLDGDDFKFTVLPKKGYCKTDEFAVKIGDTVLMPDEKGVYTIANVTDNKTISITGHAQAETVSAYLSVSHDADFIKSSAEGSKVAVLQKIDVPWFDLSLYGLDEYTIPANETGYQQPTMLHMLIIATETLYCGLDASEAGQGYLYENNLMSTLLKVEQAPKSLYMKQLWGYDENLRYFYNYIYPYYPGTTTGATADRIVLSDDDVVTIGHFVDWDAHNDPLNGVNYLVAGTGEKTQVTVEQGDELTLTVRRVGGGMGAVSTDVAVEAVQELYYTAAENVSTGKLAEWAKFGTTTAAGQLTTEVTLEPGNYIIAVAGRFGTDNTPNEGKDNSQKICSAPGAILLTVEEKVNSDAEQDAAAAGAVFDLIEALPTEVTLDNEAQIVAAREAYEELTRAQKAYVFNLSKLTAAEATLAALKDAAAAAAVDAQIEAIGAVTLEDEADIRKARIAYNILSDTQKALVTKLETLTAAEAELDRLKREANPFTDMYQATQTYLTSLSAPTVGVTNGEWRVIGLARSGKAIGNSYYDNVVAHVTEHIDENGRLDRNKSTENSRVILALTALGKDVTDVGGYNLLSGLNDMAYIGNQGFNGTIWALIAFDSGNYATPKTGDVSRDALIEAILRRQTSDGGWALSGDTYDSDITGMTLQALAPYYESNAEVKTAVDNALVCLSNGQQANGGFITDGSPTSESVAQVITALTTLGINPHTDSRFVKNDVSALDALTAYYLGNGKFEHGIGSGYNPMATEQAFYAMVAYDRFVSGKTALYDMSDVGDAPVATVTPVESVELEEETVTVVAKGRVQLTATVKPDNATDKAVIWSSSDENVATVDSNGLVTAVAEGSAIITVKTVDGGKTATCKVTVTAASVDEKYYFGLSEKEIAGWVTISFEDNGVRRSDELNRIKAEYKNPLGTIISATSVPFKSGDSIADVTARLLTELGMTYDFTGSFNNNFYLAYINNFTVNGTHYGSFGEFDAGQGSGWMITWNGWFIDRSTSEFQVRDNDVIRWQYTCQYGADLGRDAADIVGGNDENDKDKEDADDKTDIEADVQVSVSGNTATVDKVVLPEADSSTDAAAGNIVLDFSEVESSQPITTVAIPSDIVKQIADASGEAQKLEIVLTGGAAIELDAAALSEKASKSGGSDVKVSIENTANNLVGAQKEAVGSRPAYDIKITSGGKNISDMGKPITVYVPYTLKTGEKARGLIVFYVDDNGSKERCTTSYDAANKRVKWNTDHLSVYMIDYDEKLANNPFDDVADSAYYYDAVLWAYDSGITSGTSDTTFSPDASCTRAQMVTFLWRAAGKPEAKVKTHSFTDVDESAYYYEALLWAVENGITSGTSATTFSPDAACTRGQMAAFLYRSAKSPAVSGTHAFTDVAADAYYNKAVIWAAAEGITSGTSATTFSPDANCTRGQMAAFLYRYLAK